MKVADVIERDPQQNSRGAVFVGTSVPIKLLFEFLEDDQTMETFLDQFPMVTRAQARAVLGASRWQSFVRVVFPIIAPALLTGFALAFARAIGEYGSVIFIAGNMPMVSEITPLLIITKLEQYDYAGATAIAVVMLVVSFALLLAINGLQAWTRRRQGALT